MKALVIHQFGGPDVFRLSDLEKPKISENQVLIRIKAIGINPVDTKVRAGSNRISKMISLPAVIGWDASGIVEEAGSGVQQFKKGDPVFGCIGFPGAGGAYAEYAVADEDQITLKPDNLPFEELAALPIAGLTAFQAVNQIIGIKKGERLLIQAAAGGVGHLAVQFAGQKGAYVIGTASERNHEFLKGLGVDRIIDYKKEKFEEKAGEVDAVLDMMGGEVLHRSISIVKKGGKVICLPSSTKDDPLAIRLAKEKEVMLTWPMMQLKKGQLRFMGLMMAEGKLKIHLDRIFPFQEMNKAHEVIETHATTGKIVVRGWE